MTPHLSVVVPAYREAARIGDTIARLREAVGDAEIVVVDDGSGDGTADAAAAAGAAVVRFAVNRGKGAAVREGIRASRGDVVVFTDADLSYSPADVMRVAAEVDAGWDVAVGTRTQRGGGLRQISGLVFNFVTRHALGVDARDTQCGLKAFSRPAARRLFDAARTDGFAFDVELFIMARRLELKVSEVPVTVASKPGSSVRLGPEAWRMVRDLMRIRRFERAGAYDRPD